MNDQQAHQMTEQLRFIANNLQALNQQLTSLQQAVATLAANQRRST